jgi:uncharacterized membrane protein YfcA
LITFAVIAATGLIAATAQAVAGFGFALLAVPLLVTVLDVPTAVGLAALLSGLNVAWVAISSRRHTPWDLVLPILAGSLCGMPLGLALLLGVSSEILRVIVSLVSITMAAALGLGLSIPAAGRRASFAVGGVAGLLTTSIAINGPPVVLYLQALGKPPEEFRAAISTFFLLNGAVSLSAFVATGVIGPDTLRYFLVGFPAILIGSLLGRLILPYFQPETFRRFVFALLVLGALVPLVHSVRVFLG